MAKVFISYQRRPSAILATYLHEKLRQHGIEAYVDTRQVDTGGHFPDRLIGAIKDSDVFICLVADTTFESDWVRREIEHACTLGKTMIPVFQESYAPLREMPDQYVEELLQSDGIQILDTKNVFIDESVEKLARMIRRTAPHRAPRVRPVLAVGLVTLAVVAGGVMLLPRILTPPTAVPTATGLPTIAPSPVPAVTELPTAASSPVPTDILSPSPSPAQTATPGCPSALPVRLTAPGVGYVRTDDPRQLNIRLGPSTDFRLAGQIAPGETFDVLEGPTCAGPFAWFRIRYGDIEGWIAEGDTTYFVEPYVPTATPPDA